MGANIILAIGALVIFGTFLSSSNRLMTGNTQIAEQNEYYITAVSLAQSVIDEAKTKAFDQLTVGRVIPIPSADSLTPANQLGPGGSEAISGNDVLSSTGYKSSTKFNDVDDYNDYNRLVNTPRAEGYRIHVAVKYVSETSPDVVKGAPTFCKRMKVMVTSPFFPSHRSGGASVPDTLSISYAFTY